MSPYLSFIFLAFVSMASGRFSLQVSGPEKMKTPTDVPYHSCRFDEINTLIICTATIFLHPSFAKKGCYNSSHLTSMEIQLTELQAVAPEGLGHQGILDGRHRRFSGGPKKCACDCLILKMLLSWQYGYINISTEYGTWS